MSKKLRPERIIKGFSKAFLADVSSKIDDVVEDRRAMCKKPCQYLKNGNVCGICGCFIKQKTIVNEEYCPENFWNDIKVIKEVGIAIRNLKPLEYNLTHIGSNRVMLTLFEPIPSGIPYNFSVQVINARGDFDFESTKLTNIQTKGSCVCTASNEVPTSLTDGNSFLLDVKYSANKKGEFNQIMKVVSNEDTFYIDIKGKVE